MGAYGDFFGSVGQAAGGGLIGAGINAINQAINYKYATRMADYNFGLNEKAADAADARRRALYADFESPMAKIRQLKEAGLSPSLYAGGELGSGIGSTSGAQGGGGAGAAIPSSAASAIDLSAVNLNNALAKQAEANAKNKDADTAIKEIEQLFKNMEFSLYNIDFSILSGIIQDGGTSMSYSEYAKKFNTFDEFSNALHKEGASENLFTEQGQRTLRQIYKASRELDTELSQLTQAGIDAKLATKISQELNNSDYAKLNAQSAIKHLQKTIAEEQLDQTQKDAWNRLLKKLGEEGNTWRDIAIVLGLVVNNALSHYKY